jgi:Xaa-Pro aminopeptidase
LQRIGLLKGDLRTLLNTHAYRKFFMHRTGHWLGMDVHDVGDYKVSDHWRLLEPGMVLTVEPGIYLPDNRSVPKKWRGIGVRIEDDVLVTATGHEVLSKALPVDPDEIERLIGTAAA